jgi:membrane protease YdiL (CAAX protease family)
MPSLTVRHAIPVGGAVLLAASAALLYATGHTTVPASTDHRPGELWRLWPPILVTLLLVRLLPWTIPETGHIAERLNRKMSGRSPRRDVAVLLGCVVLFYVLDLLLSAVLSLVDPTLTPLSYFISKAFFLFLVPVVLVGAVGVMRYASGPDVTRLSLKVVEPWRWWGLVAVAGYVLAVLTPWAARTPAAGEILPDRFTVAGVLIVTLLWSPVLEEVFFRGMLQTRLEYVVGRWPGIVLASGVYAAAGLIGGTAPNGAATAVATAVCVQGTAGLMYGYLWSRYRNMWLNLLLHTATVVFVLTASIAGG